MKIIKIDLLNGIKVEAVVQNEIEASYVYQFMDEAEKAINFMQEMDDQARCLDK
jgi:hypothetical protein